MELHPEILASLHEIPDGRAGVYATLSAMAEITRDFARHPDIIVLARSLVGHLDGKNFLGEAREVHRFVRDEIRYVRDVLNVETLQTPDVTLALRSGDCDDKSILVGALLAAIGHPVRYLAIGLNGGDFEHVLAETKIGAQWRAVETTEPVALGWLPPMITSMLRVYV